MSVTKIPTTHPVQPVQGLLSAEACEILQQGIRAALIEEAMRWTDDARVDAWSAIIGAGQRMGIAITSTELYRAQIELRGARSAPPQTSGPAILCIGRRLNYMITTAPTTTEQSHGQV